MQLVCVKWRDAYLNEGWHSEQDVEKIKGESVWIVSSLGWLVDQNEDRVIICQSISDNGAYSEVLKIPAEAIADIEILATPDD